MKLLLYSHYFASSIGGVETIVMSLARGLADLRAENGAREFEITLVTQTPREDFDDSALPFPVVRQPGFWRLMRLMRGADVVHLAGPALGPLALGLLWRKPVVIEHHGFQVICPTGQLLIESNEWRQTSCRRNGWASSLACRARQRFITDSFRLRHANERTRRLHKFR